MTYPFKTRIRNLFIKIRDSIVHLNLFSSHATGIHANEIRNQRISTAIFIISLCIFFLILSINVAVQKITRTFTVKDATYDSYQSLSDEYSETLSCQCSSVSIERGVFMDVQPIFYPICSSDFVSDKFLQYLSAQSLVSIHLGYNQFRFLRSMCDMINATIIDSFTVFKKRQFVSQEVISSDVFNEQIRDMINEYIISIIHEFITSLSFTKLMTVGNKLMMTYGTNVFLTTLTNPLAVEIYFSTYLYGPSCDCLLEACAIPLLILSNSELIDIPGFYIGCYPVDYIMKSDLQCFYDENCTARYLTLYESTRTFNISVLDSPIISLSISTSINDLLENLFVENWTTSVSHMEYYNQCRPSSCSYSISTHNDIITILTITLGFLGGIQIILRFLVPKLVKLISRSCIDTETTGKCNFSRKSVENIEFFIFRSNKTKFLMAIMEQLQNNVVNL